MTAGHLPLVVALLLVALTVLVLIKESRPGRVPLAFGILLLAALESLDAPAIRDLLPFGVHSRLTASLKALIPGSLLLYGVVLARTGAGRARALLLLTLLSMVGVFSSLPFLLPVDQMYVGFDPSHGGVLILESIGYWYYVGLMIFCVAALVNLESVFSGIRGGGRWLIKYEFLGVGAILVAQIFYVSQALLNRVETPPVLPVRAAAVLVSAMLIAYSRFYRGRTANIVVSRQALYRSFTLVAVGLYLLVLGLFGAGMQRLGMAVTPHLTMFIAILAGLAFLVLVLSEAVRRRLRVILAKHFYAQRYDYRDEWLGVSGSLAGCRGLAEARLAILERYQHIFGLRFAVLYNREGGGSGFALASSQGRTGLPARAVLSPGLIHYFAETGRVMNPADGEYTLTADEAAFVRDVEAWLLVPLLASERLEAFVVFGRQVAPEGLTYEDFDLMKIIGRQAVLSLKNFQLSEDLSEAREMAAVAKVSSFVIHDLKNLAYTFSLMLENAGEHIGEPEFQHDLVQSIRNTVAKMNALVGKLKVFPDKRELNTEAVDLARIAQETLDEVRNLKPGVAFAADLAVASTCVDIQETRKVAINLLLNACDAVGDKGKVHVRTGQRGTESFLDVEDDGCGMSEAFLQDHLFKPFRTTKEKGLGIGLHQCKQIVEAHGGRIEVTSREGKGTVFTVILPGEPQKASSRIPLGAPLPKGDFGAISAVGNK